MTLAIEVCVCRDLTQAQSLRWTVNEVEAAFAALQSDVPRKPTATEIEEIACAKFEAMLQLAHECGLDAVAIEQSIAGVQAKLDLDDPAKGGRKRCIVDRDYALFRAEIAALDARRQALLGIQPAPPQTFGRSAIDPVTLQPVVPIRSKSEAHRLAHELADRGAVRLQTGARGSVLELATD